MSQEQDRQCWGNKGHGHLGGDCSESSEEPGKPAAAVSQNVLLLGKAPPTRAPEPQSRVKIAPLDDDRGRLGLRTHGCGECSLDVTVQARLEVHRLTRKALRKLPLQECP